MKYKIHNMIISTSVGRDIELDKLSVNLSESEYEPEQFPGLVYRTYNPKSGILLFTSGRLNIVGVRSVAEAREVFKQIVKILRKNGIRIREKPRLKVENIVASAKIAKEINLDRIGFLLKNTEYEPEQFPGLIYRMDDPRLVFLLFSSGKIVCVGAKRIKDIGIGIKKLTRQIEQITKKSATAD